MFFSQLKIPRPTIAQGVLFGLIVLSCTVDFSRRLSLAGVSGLGAFTLAAGGAVWIAWLLRPLLPSGLLAVFLPLILFAVDAVCTLFWYPPGMDGVQLLVVGLTFLGAMMLAARESAFDSELSSRLRFLIIVTSALPVMSWLFVLKTGIVSAGDSNLSRAFALYTLTVVGVSLATWRGMVWPEWIGGHRAARRNGPSYFLSYWPLLWAGFVAFVVLLGMSRTALVIIALLIPLSLIYRGSSRAFAQGLLIMIAGAGSFAVLLQNYKPLHDRFFAEDASMKVGGVAINGSGRSAIWSVVVSNVRDDWFMGKGVSSSEDLVAHLFKNVGQPHNDYLRFYYDQGVLGLSLWLVFVAVFVRRTISNLRRSIRNQTPDYVQHLAALLSLTGVSLSMLTDNSYCYSFVMFPLAVVMGCSLGSGQYYARLESASFPVKQSPFFEPIMAPILRSR